MTYYIINHQHITEGLSRAHLTTPTSVGESPDSLNLISRTSSRASKRIHPRGRSRARRTVRHSSEEEVSPGPRTPTASRIITGKLSHRIAPLQLSVAPFPSAPEGRTHSMSWDDQVSAEESRGLASGVICAP